MTAGAYHACALRADGTVRCWGSNAYGQLGDGSRESRPKAVLVSGLRDATAIAAGAEFTCAVRATGAVACWGRNWFGELGAASPRAALLPQDVPFLDDATQITAGHVHACARRRSGSVSCWGGNLHGQAADHVATARVPVVTVRDLEDASAVIAGSEFTCAQRPKGVRCWGAVKEPPEFGTPITAFAATRDVVCARADKISCWRTENTNELAEPTQLEGAALALMDSGTYGRTLCTIDASGGVICFDGVTRGTKRIAGITNAIAIDGGLGFACVADRTGDAYCWGTNKLFQLGDGTIADRDSAVRVEELR